MKLTFTDKKHLLDHVQKCVETKTSFSRFRKVLFIYEVSVGRDTVSKVKRYLDDRSYLKLNLLFDNVVMGEDELGLMVISDSLQVFLLLDDEDNYYLLCIIRHTTRPSDYKNDVVFFEKVKKFNYRLYFRNTQVLNSA